jgi:hypothetical protein
MHQENCEGRRMGPDARRVRFSVRALLVVIGLAGVLLGAVRIVQQSAWWNGGVVPIEFDSEMWQEATPIGNSRTVRSRMVEDLLRHHNLVGRPRDEVVSILGPPDTGATLAEASNADAIVYYIGKERQGWASLDREYLLIEFAENDCVAECRLLVD